MKPFLLNLMSEARPAKVPKMRFDEGISLNMILDTGLPLASSRHLLATATKTEAAPETDDDDPDYSTEITRSEGGFSSQERALATLTKTAEEKESDDSD